MPAAFRERPSRALERAFALASLESRRTFTRERRRRSSAWLSVNYGYERAKSHNFAVKPGEIAAWRAVGSRRERARFSKLHFANYEGDSIAPVGI